ncbi:MAG: NAD(+) diphosphatase [Pseudomonadales bacterium]|nr:NAD(+) diphosphatase [Pseudomonadales bacterium]
MSEAPREQTGITATGSDMWPMDPDEFEVLLHPPEGADRNEAMCFLIIDGRLACVSERGIPRPVSGDELRWLDIEITSEHYLGRYRGRCCIAIEARGRLPEGFALAGLRDWLGRVEPPLFYLAGRAQQVIEWHNTHRFCGRCGSAMEDHGADRAKTCPECDLVCYPRLAPSIIVLVTKGEELLLARNANWPTNMFSTLAGFVEPGESIEQTVHREVMEEVGLTVRNLRYRGSQSWPFPNQLMLGFHAQYAGGEICCNDEEIAEARWFRADNLPNIPPRTAISRWLIDAFLENGG